MDTWDSMQHWQLVIPPSRPSAAQLDRIKSAIKGIGRSEPVAVLGSTPEFRDFLHECGFEKVHVLDRNGGFYESMSAARIYKNTETFVHGNWLETLPGFRDFFSVILSDLTSGNVPYEHRGFFYDLVTHSLKAGGLFFDKILTHPGSNLSVDDLASKYAQLPLNLVHINYFSCEMLFCSELLDINNTVDSSHFYSILDQRITHPRVRAFVTSAQKITPKQCVWWYGRKWKQLELEYCPALMMVEAADDTIDSPYFGRAKQFIHMRRSK